MEQDNWTRFNRINVVLSLIAGLLTIAQVIWAGRQILSAGLQASVPAWLLLATAITAFLLGWFLKHKVASLRRSTTSQHFKKIGQVRFDYLPDSPDKHGWSLGPENDANLAPDFSAAANAPMPGCLLVKDKGNYYLDYEVGPSESLSDVVELLVQPTKNSWLYIKIKVTSRDKSTSRTVWLKHVIGKKEPSKLDDGEWVIYVSGENLDNGWIQLKFSIADEVEKTFGSNGWIYQELIGIRLRGSMAISPISFYRITATEAIRSSMQTGG